MPQRDAKRARLPLRPAIGINGPSAPRYVNSLPEKTWQGVGEAGNERKSHMRNAVCSAHVIDKRHPQRVFFFANRWENISPPLRSQNGM